MVHLNVNGWTPRSRIETLEIMSFRHYHYARVHYKARLVGFEPTSYRASAFAAYRAIIAGCPSTN